MPEIHASKCRHKVQVLPGCAVGQPDQEGGIFRRQVLTAIKKAEPLVQAAQPAYLALLGSRAVKITARRCRGATFALRDATV